MNAMDDAKGKPIFDPNSKPIQPVRGSMGDKEKAGGLAYPEMPIDIGKEIDLPKEVVNVGVKKTPTVVQIPKPVVQMGVKPAGSSSPPLTAPVVLPLKEKEIVEGLNIGVIFSWRWLSEWCIRRLKQLRLISKK